MADFDVDVDVAVENGAVLWLDTGFFVGDMGAKFGLDGCFLTKDAGDDDDDDESGGGAGFFIDEEALSTPSTFTFDDDDDDDEDGAKRSFFDDAIIWFDFNWSWLLLWILLLLLLWTLIWLDSFECIFLYLRFDS